MTTLVLAVLLAADAGSRDSGASDALPLTRKEAEQAYLKATQDVAWARARKLPVEAALAEVERTRSAVTAARLREVGDKRRAKDDEERVLAASREQAAGRAADPVWARIVLSGVLCDAMANRAAAKKRIADEKKYARAGGGVIDLQEIYVAQGIMRDADDSTRWASAALKKAKQKPAACSTPAVDAIVGCLMSPRLPPGGQPLGEPGPCDDPSVQEHLLVYDQLRGN